MAFDRIHSFYWLWLPVLFLIAQMAVELVLPKDILINLLSEGGPHEMMQFFIILAAFVVGLVTLPRVPLRSHKFLFFWTLLATVCCFYVAFEEISWGQHIFEWTTPEFWSQVNDQDETNFHNTSSWLDQKPRILLELGVVVGGLVFPLILKFKPQILPAKFSIIYPTYFLSVIAGAFLVLKIIDKADAFGVMVFYRVSEIQELYLFYFVLLYLVILRGKIKALAASD